MLLHQSVGVNFLFNSGSHGEPSKVRQINEQRRSTLNVSISPCYVTEDQLQLYPSHLVTLGEEQLSLYPSHLVKLGEEQLPMYPSHLVKLGGDKLSLYKSHLVTLEEEQLSLYPSDLTTLEKSTFHCIHLTLLH